MNIDIPFSKLFSVSEINLGIKLINVIRYSLIDIVSMWIRLSQKRHQSNSSFFIFDDLNKPYLKLDVDLRNCCKQPFRN